MWSKVMGLQEGLIILVEKKRQVFITNHQQNSKSLSFPLYALTVSDSSFFKLIQTDMYEWGGLRGVPVNFITNPYRSQPFLHIGQPA